MTNANIITLPSQSAEVVHSSPTSLLHSFPSNRTNLLITPVTTAQQGMDTVNQQHTQSYLQLPQIHPEQQMSTYPLHPTSQQSHMNTTTSATTPSNANNSNNLHYVSSVADWVGGTNKGKISTLSFNNDWKDVDRNIKQMDQLYDATFYSWLKAEDNVLITAMYLHRITSEYSLDRVINAVMWLVSDWRWESTSILVRHITADWCDEEGDMRRAKLLRHLTETWATQYTATFITSILASPPYTTTTNIQRERFTRAFTDGWGFSKLSEFFMYLQSQANINYKVKCLMLQEAAGRERKKLSAKLERRRRQHHSREQNATSSISTSPTTCNTIEKNPQPTNELALHSSAQTNDHRSGASITRCHHHEYRHRSGLNCDEYPLERSSGVSQPSTSSLSSHRTDISQQHTHVRYHRQHHRRISSSDMMDAKRQLFSSAFDEEVTDYKQDDQHSNVNYILSSSGSSSTRTNNKNSTTSTIATTITTSTSDETACGVFSSPSSTATTSSTQSPSTMLYDGDESLIAENGNLTGDLSGMGLGSAVRGGCSAGSGTTPSPTSPSLSSSPSTISVHHHHRQTRHINNHGSESSIIEENGRYSTSAGSGANGGGVTGNPYWQD